MMPIKISYRIREEIRVKERERDIHAPGMQRKEDARREGRREIGERESSVHLRVKWTVDKINRDGKEISSRRTRARRKKSRATAEKGNFE